MVGAAIAGKQIAAGQARPNDDHSTRMPLTHNPFEAVLEFKTDGGPRAKKAENPSEAFERAARAEISLQAPELANRWQGGLQQIRTLSRLYQSFRNHIKASDETVSAVVDLLNMTIAAAPAGETHSLEIAELHNFLGNALMELGDRRPDVTTFRDAAGAYQKAADIWRAAGQKAACIRVEINHGVALTSLSKEEGLPPEEREEVGKKALSILQWCVLQLKPDTIDWERAHLNLANALMAQNRFEDALNSYRKAVTDRYRHADAIGWAIAQSNYSTALIEFGNYQDAIDACQAALQSLSPLSQRSLAWGLSHHYLGNAYRKLGERDLSRTNLEAATAAYNTALQAFPPSSAHWANSQYELGLALRRLDEQDPAIQAFYAAAGTSARISAKTRSEFLEGLRIALREKEESLKRLVSGAEGVEITASAPSLVPTGSNPHIPIGNEIFVSLWQIYTLTYGVNKKTTIAQKFEIFLDAIGVQAPDLKASLADRVLPLIESAAAGTFPADGSATNPEKPSLQLPPAAPELYRDRTPLPELGRKENIPEFLLRVWGPYMQTGLLTRVELRRLDSSADTAVDNWLRHRPLPEDIFLPTKQEVNTAAIASLNFGPHPIVRLGNVIESRIRKGTPIP